MKEAVPSGAAFFVPGRRRGVRGGVRLGGGAGMSGMSGVCRVSRGCREGNRGVEFRVCRSVECGMAGSGGRSPCDAVTGDAGERLRRTIPNVREKGGSGGCRSVSAGRTERREEVDSPDGDGSDEGGTAIAGRSMAATKAGRHLRNGRLLRRRRRDGAIAGRASGRNRRNEVSDYRIVFDDADRSPWRSVLRGAGRRSSRLSGLRTAVRAGRFRG